MAGWLARRGVRAGLVVVSALVLALGLARCEGSGSHPFMARSAASTHASKPDPWEWAVQSSGHWVDGCTHAQALTLGTAAQEYTISNEGNHWIEIQCGNLCWNVAPVSGSPVTMDSCIANDANEWFNDSSFQVDCTNSEYFNIGQKASTYYVSSDGNGHVILTSAPQGTNGNRSCWLPVST
jgi:hypothetical protein